MTGVYELYMYVYRIGNTIGQFIFQTGCGKGLITISIIM